MPGTGDYVVHWTITDKIACRVLYTLPFTGEPDLDNTFAATGSAGCSATPTPTATASVPTSCSCRSTSPGCR
jgi:hypothetical protein